jgi:hypothetical protein
MIGLAPRAPNSYPSVSPPLTSGLPAPAMPPRTALFALITALGLLAAGGRLAAEVHAACCRCASFFVVEPTGAGFLRHHIGFCPRCTSEMGGSAEAYLEQLRGKNRGLTDAAQLTLAQLRQAIRQRDAARDSIYGTKGSATKFFTSLINLASEGAKGAVKEVGKNVKKGLSWYNRGHDTGQGDFKWVAAEGKKWVEGKTVGKAKDKAALKAAAAIGRNYFDRTGDARGATNRFLDAHRDIKKGVSILESAIDFYEKTDALANGIQEYLEQRGNALRLEKEWNDIMDEVEKVLAEIAKIQHCLDLKAQQSKSGASTGRGNRGWTGRFASADAIAMQRAEVKALVHPRDEPDAGPMGSALASLKQLRPQLEGFIKELEEEMLPPLLPFWLEVEEEFGPKLNRALLEWADPSVERASRQYDRIMRYGEGAVEHLQQAHRKWEKI